MRSNTFLILGGYGNTGRLIAQLLLQETDISLVLAGRNADRARAFAARLNSKYPGDRVTGISADASNAESLERAFKDIDLVVVASSTSQFTRQVATAALAAGIDYLDVQYSTSKLAFLKSMQAEIEAAGRCFITEAGFHPGLPAVLVHYAAQRSS